MRHVIQPFTLYAAAARDTAILAGGIVGIEQAIEPPDELHIMAGVCPSGSRVFRSRSPRRPMHLSRTRHFADVIGSVMCSHWINTPALGVDDVPHDRGDRLRRPSRTGNSTILELI